MSPPDFRLIQNAAAASAARESFAQSGHVRLRDVFNAQSAGALHQHLDSELAWSRVVNQGEQVWDLGPESIAALAAGTDAPLIAQVNKGARDGFQFLFDSVRVSDQRDERLARGLLLDLLIEALNAEESLALLRRITGLEAIARVDGQATRYLAGHFLTGHDDAIDGKGRLAAYVINLTPEWRTEWGGMLLFHDADGDIVRGLKPCFNAMHLFRVPQVHSVSQVTAFAGAPRLSVTGWLRSW